MTGFNFDEMDIAPPEGVRRLPIYLLLDCSYSMKGDAIEAVRYGVRRFMDDVQADTSARQTAAIGVITFNSNARMVTNGLLTIEEFQEQFDPAMLKATGNTSLGKALRLLAKSLERDVKANIKGQAVGDWKPLIFILTDGSPTDAWQKARQEIYNRQTGRVLEVVTVGCGSGIDHETLKKIAIGRTFYMESTKESFKSFFDWVTQSIRAAAYQITQPVGNDDYTEILNTSPSENLQYVE